jgi:hypothetical protein
VAFGASTFVYRVLGRTVSPSVVASHTVVSGPNERNETAPSGPVARHVPLSPGFSRLTTSSLAVSPEQFKWTRTLGRYRIPKQA